VALALAALALARTGGAPREVTGARAVAFTIDDLPASRSGSLADMRRINADLLRAFAAAGIPAIGFVNEVKLHITGEEGAREQLLADWLDAGHELGNHGYQHIRFQDASLEAMETDVLDGERVTRRLLAARGRTPPLVPAPDAQHRPRQREPGRVRVVPRRARLCRGAGHDGQRRVDLRRGVRPGTSARGPGDAGSHRPRLHALHGGGDGIPRAALAEALRPRHRAYAPPARERAEPPGTWTTWRRCSAVAATGS
jgi:peptidoglycan/xylan/chitin deacetylase (PgdA/CDA1 family)